MKQPIRFFSIGLITASIVVLIIIYLVDKPETISQNDMNVDEMIETIKDEGYHVLSSSEYITLSAKKDEQEDTENNQETNNDTNNDENVEVDKDKEESNKQDDEENEKTEENKENEVEDEVTSYTLDIKVNMLGPEVSKVLAQNKIIDKADDFNRYLETEGYAQYIQLGKFQLKSDMSNYEIAEKIARKR